ncbi:M48 family metallopeptidase [Flavobacterium faecale]|uniref:M48 family metallopeptidase n=1 Tax=Flavobacterium faecale TaxID=1355330 RepID=UPI003AB0EF9D
MSHTATAIYYDGKTAIPQTIAVFFNTFNGTIEFRDSNEINIKWPISDIAIEKRLTGLFLEYEDENLQHIRIEDQKLIDSIQLYRKNNGHISWYQKLIDLGTVSHFIIAFGIIIIIGLCYFFAIPWVGEKSVVLIPNEYDDKLGSSAWIKNEYLISIDAAKTKTLNDFASQLDLNNSKKLEFTVVKSNEVNAFALPDGNIIVFTGILKEMKNYDELVGLLGHEASHVNNRHSMKMLCRSLSGYLFISVILGDANGVMATIGDNVNSLQSLSFSREFERQADEDGFQILVKNKVNPQGMANLFQRLQHKNLVEIPEFLSSHPVTEDRITSINKMIQTKSFAYNHNPQLEKLFIALKK